MNFCFNFCLLAMQLVTSLLRLIILNQAKVYSVLICYLNIPKELDSQMLL